MKPLAVTLSCVVCVVTAFAQTTATTDKAAPAPPAKKSGIRIELPPDKAPGTGKAAAPAAGTKAADKAGKEKKEEPPPKIEGMEIARGGDKGFLGVQIVNATFKINFYDAKKKPMAPDVARAALRWDPKYKIGEERVILNPAEKALTSPRNIRPPYNFKLFITFFKEPAEGADAVVSENYTIDFRG